MERRMNDIPEGIQLTSFDPEFAREPDAVYACEVRSFKRLKSLMFRGCSEIQFSFK